MLIMPRPDSSPAVWGAPRVSPAQKTQQAQTQDQNAFGRVEGGKDFAQNQSQFMSVLDGLKHAGYVGAGGSSVSSRGTSSGASGGGMGTMAPWTPTMPSAAPAAAVAPVNTAGAQAAAFARAKDQVGQTASSALSGLRSALGGRGMLGSGAESRGTAGVINAGQAELGDVSREQAIDAAGLAERQATTNYQGDIAQRGQNLNAAANERSLALSARGQDIGAADARAGREAAATSASASREQDNLRSILGLWSAFGGQSSRASRY